MSEGGTQAATSEGVDRAAIHTIATDAWISLKPNITHGQVLVRAVKDLNDVPRVITQMAFDAASQARFCRKMTLRTNVHRAAGFPGKLTQGALLMSGAAPAMTPIATFYPLVVTPEILDDTRSRVSNLTYLLIAFEKADEEWVSEWYSTVPQEMLDISDNKMITALTLLISLCGILEEKLAHLVFSVLDFKMRFALWMMLRDLGVPCTQGCSGKSLYGWEYYALHVDSVCPCTAFLGRSQIPCTAVDGENGCRHHGNAVVLVAGQNIPKGRTYATVARRPAFTLEYKSLAEMKHPAATNPCRIYQVGNNVAAVNADMTLRSVVKGSGTAVQAEVLTGCDTHNIVFSTIINRNEQLKDTIALVNKRLRHTNNFDTNIVERSRHWPTTLTVRDMHLFSILSICLQKCTPSNKATKQHAKEASGLLLFHYARSLHSFDMPILMLELAAAVEYQHQKATDDRWDTLRTATHLDLFRRVALSYVQARHRVASGVGEVNGLLDITLPEAKLLAHHVSAS